MTIWAFLLALVVLWLFISTAGGREMVHTANNIGLRNLKATDIKSQTTFRKTLITNAEENIVLDTQFDNLPEDKQEEIMTIIRSI